VAVGTVHDGHRITLNNILEKFSFSLFLHG
jgi:hypothetical protein